MNNQYTFYKVKIFFSNQSGNQTNEKHILVNALTQWEAMEKVATYFKNIGYVILNIIASEDEYYEGALLNGIFVRDDKYPFLFPPTEEEVDPDFGVIPEEIDPDFNRNKNLTY